MQPKTTTFNTNLVDLNYKKHSLRKSSNYFDDGHVSFLIIIQVQNCNALFISPKPTDTKIK